MAVVGAGVRTLISLAVIISVTSSVEVGPGPHDGPWDYVSLTYALYETVTIVTMKPRAQIVNTFGSFHLLIFS